MRIRFDDPENSPRPGYSIEYTAEAMQAIEGAAAWYGNSSRAFATRWSDGLQSAIGNLAIQPESQPIAGESRYFGASVRRMLYRQGRTAYNVFYTVVEPIQNHLQGTVRILLVRNAVMRPLGEDIDESDEP